MKLYELLTESKKQVDEAPMGAVSGLANKAMAKFGSGKAAGKVDTGNIANQLRKEFDVFLGKTGSEATKAALIDFLKSKGYPTKGASQVINQTTKTAAAPTGPMAAAGNLKTRAAQAVSNTINKVTDKFKPQTSQEPEKIEPTGEPAAEKPAPSYKQGNYKEPTYSVNKGFDMSTMKNVTEPIGSDVVGGVPSKKKKKVAVSASKEIDSSRAISEAGLPSSVIDKAILKAAQEAELVKTKQPVASATSTAAAPTDNSTATADEPASSKGGFGAGFKQGLTGKKAAAPDLTDLEKRIAAIEKKVGLA